MAYLAVGMDTKIPVDSVLQISLITLGVVLYIFTLQTHVLLYQR